MACRPINTRRFPTRVLTLCRRCACTAAQCGDPIKPLHGTVGDCIEGGEDHCTYTCDAGYQCSAECTDATSCPADCGKTCPPPDGDQLQLLCSAKPCNPTGDAGVPDLAEHMGIGTCTQPLLSGDSCAPTCEEGYELHPAPGATGLGIECLNGQWLIPTCVEKGCLAADVQVVRNAIPHVSRHADACILALPDGGHCMPECDEFSDQSSAASSGITCASGHATLDPSFKCELKPCTGADKAPDHGSQGGCTAPNLQPEEAGPDWFCRPECDPGYILQGNASRECKPHASGNNGLSGGTCVATTCNATGAGSDQEYDGSRTGEGNCSGALPTGQSCVPACKAPDYRPVGLTTCNLGNLTTVAHCRTKRPSLSDIGCDLDDLKSDHQCNPQGYGTVTLLYFWLAGIFSMGLCGTASMASGKVSRREYEATTDWSRVN